MTPRVPILAVAATLVVPACGDGADPVPAAPTTIAPTTVATTTTVVATTTVVPTTTTTTTTTMPAPGLLPLEAVAGLPTLDDGRPATFLAVTDDYEAVEVDTLTGQVIRRIGQADDQAAVEASEVEAATAVIDGVWRTRDGSEMMVSVCCEPARGIIFYLGPNGTFQINPTPERTTPGWSLATSPVDGSYAVLGFDLAIAGPGGDLYTEPVGERFASGPPTYSIDGTTLYWLTSQGLTGWYLESADFGSSDSVRRAIPLDWVPADARLVGVAAAADGTLTTFQVADDGATEAVVMSTDGEVISSRPLVAGATIGSFDDAGTYFIYADGDGAVRWYGGGGMGVLGSGYLFATW